MPTIEFRTFNKESFEVFRPVAAKDLQPDWWKKLKIRVDQRGRTTQTIRSCPSMQDWLTMGYYIVATQDIQFIAEAHLSKGMIYFNSNKVNEAIEEFLFDFID